MSASEEFKQAAEQDVVRPVHLVRVLEIPPVNPATHETDYLYLTDADTNVTWFDEFGNSQTYYSCGMTVEEAERSKDQTTDQCHISLDNVDNRFTALAQYYKLNGVYVEVYLGFQDTLDSDTGATLKFCGRIRSITIGQTQIDAVVSQGFDSMNKVPRRICWTSLFPYIPSAKDPRELNLRT